MSQPNQPAPGLTPLSDPANVDLRIWEPPADEGEGEGMTPDEALEFLAQPVNTDQAPDEQGGRSG